MDEILIVAFILSGELGLKDFIPFLHYVEEELTDIKLNERIFVGQIQDIWVDLTDEGQYPTGVFI